MGGAFGLDEFWRNFVSADVHDLGAAPDERAAFRRCTHFRWLARDLPQVFMRAIYARKGTQKSVGIRVERGLQHLPNASRFHHAARVHHGDLVSHLGDDAEIVRDK